MLQKLLPLLHLLFLQKANILFQYFCFNTAIKSFLLYSISNSFKIPKLQVNHTIRNNYQLTSIIFNTITNLLSESRILSFKLKYCPLEICFFRLKR